MPPAINVHKTKNMSAYIRLTLWKFSDCTVKHTIKQVMK